MGFVYASLVLLALIGLGLLVTLRANASALRKVESFDLHGPEARDLARDLSETFDAEALRWQPGLDSDGVTIHTALMDTVADQRVRAYRVTSWLEASEISVDRMVELLDGGFLTEELWHKEDYQGGDCLETLHRDEHRSDWLARYVSAMPPLRQREFVYLLSRREMPAAHYSKRWHPPGDTIERQVCIGYRSVNRETGHDEMVRAIQYPSLDRITCYASGKIRWEHIMAFHIAGAMPHWVTNALAQPAMKVLHHEAVNMRKHVRPASNSVPSVPRPTSAPLQA